MRISPLNSICEFEHYNYHLGIDQPCNHENKGRCASNTIEAVIYVNICMLTKQKRKLFHPVFAESV